jgi:hypothetical protein
VPEHCSTLKDIITSALAAGVCGGETKTGLTHPSDRHRPLSQRSTPFAVSDTAICLGLSVQTINENTQAQLTVCKKVNLARRASIHFQAVNTTTRSNTAPFSF